MSQLEQLQQELARLLVAPSSTVPTGLLSELEVQELQQARQTLFRKRRAQTRHLLPRTAVALGDRYSPLFECYSAQYRFSGFRAPLRDAIAFSRWVADRREFPRWFHELAGWEAWPLRLALSAPTLRWIQLRWNVHPITTLTLESPPAKQRSSWLGFRARRRSGLWRVF